MSQTLILPITNTFVTAGYKNSKYTAAWKFAHFGMDCVSTKNTVNAMGNGTVVAAGQDGPTLTGPDSRLGNVIVIVYKDILLNDGKTIMDLTCRMFHFADILVKVGDKVTHDTVIGHYGNTGANSSGPHLHIEFDTDTAYPTLAYGVKVSISAKIINTQAEFKKAGGLKDSTISPANVWWVGNGQSIQGASSSDWYTKQEVTAPRLQVETDWKSVAEDLQQRLDQIKTIIGG